MVVGRKVEEEVDIDAGRMNVRGRSVVDGTKDKLPGVAVDVL